jgi:hypothetical protein
MTFDQSRVRELRERLASRLREVGESLGLVLTIDDRVTYNPNAMRLKLTVTEVGAAPAAQVEFNHYCARYGLTAADFGKEFDFAGDHFTLCGVQPRATRFPLLGRNAAGKVYKLPVDVVRLINPEAPPPVMRRRRRRGSRFDEAEFD